MAITTVIEPSMMNSHSQAGLPPAPSIRAVIPAAMSPENAVAIMLPPYKIATRGGSSARVYQQLMRTNTAGRNGAARAVSMKSTLQKAE